MMTPALLSPPAPRRHASARARSRWRDAAVWQRRGPPAAHRATRIRPAFASCLRLLLLANAKDLLLLLRNRHGRDVAEDQKEPEQKPRDAAHHDRPLDVGRPVRPPRVAVVIPRQR